MVLSMGFGGRFLSRRRAVGPTAASPPHQRAPGRKTALSANFPGAISENGVICGNASAREGEGMDGAGF